jgi:hypothetical protein
MQCDQIIYEAIVKACEIVVGGRCDDIENTENISHVTSQEQPRRNIIRQSSDLPRSSNYGTTPSNAARGANNCRFNLQIDELPSVRHALSPWKEQLHLPLRLDIYHEHNEGRELLERWCWDYTSSSREQVHGSISLRGVCQRIVGWLRSLYALMRILPAHHVFCVHVGSDPKRGAVKYSIYTTEESVQSLPSPSFAFQSLPDIVTANGALKCSVMYDATLHVMRSEPIPIIASSPIIRDYHSPPLRPAVEGEKRTMSGLSLVMMGEDENNVVPPTVVESTRQMDATEGEVVPWGSPATRAAFHLPPMYCGEGGYDNYGYNADPLEDHTQNDACEGLSISPSPLMSTPPQAMWGKPPTGEIPSSIIDAGSESNCTMTKPFTNPTSLQPTPCRASSQSTSNYASSLGSHSPHPQSLERSNSDVVQRKRTSSSSMVLPPVTSLDLLQKSPFSKTKTIDKVERTDSDGIAMPFILESYRDEMRTSSSIPRMISADSRGRSSGMGFGNLTISGGFYSTGPYSTKSSGQNHSQYNVDVDEMPFAVDDDFPLIGSSSNPFGKSSRLVGASGGRGDALDGMSEVTSSSLAVSSLHQRCATEGKPRLKMFESSQSIRLTSKSSNVGSAAPSKNDFATIKEQLSDFRSFGASLMVGSTHDSCSE